MGTELSAEELEETGEHQPVCAQPGDFGCSVPADASVPNGVLLEESVDFRTNVLQGNEILLQPESVWQHGLPGLDQCVPVPGHRPSSHGDGPNHSHPLSAYLCRHLAAGWDSVSSRHVLHQNAPVRH